MNILFLTDNFPPESNAPANRTIEHCREWIKQGATITVITCAPNFPKGEVHPGYKNKLYQTEYVDGIKVVRVWTYITANEGVLKRTLDYISFGIMAFFAGLFHKTGIIIATSPQFFTAIGGCFLALIKRKPWIMEVRDLWPESIKAVDALKHGAVMRFLEKIELFLYKRATRIVVVTDTFKENIIGKGIPKEKIDVVKNGVLLDQYFPLEKDLLLSQSLGLQDKFVIGYIGTHGMAHRLSFILDCAKEITDPGIHFLFVGTGAMKADLLAQKEKLGLKNVSMLPSIEKSEVNRYISITDVSLVTLRRNNAFRMVIPSKIFENAAMGKPILLGVEGESKGIVEEYNAGVCFEPENKADFLEKVSLLKNNTTLFESCKKGGFQLAKSFNRKAFAKRMLEIIVDTPQKIVVEEKEVIV